MQYASSSLLGREKNLLMNIVNLQIQERGSKLSPAKRHKI